MWDVDNNTIICTRLHVSNWLKVEQLVRRVEPTRRRRILRNLNEHEMENSHTSRRAVQILSLVCGNVDSKWAFSSVWRINGQYIAEANSQRTRARTLSYVWPNKGAYVAIQWMLQFHHKFRPCKKRTSKLQACQLATSFSDYVTLLLTYSRLHYVTVNDRS